MSNERSRDPQNPPKKTGLLASRAEEAKFGATPSHKMPVPWQARGQLSFLQSRVGEFKATQRARKGMKKFYKTTFNDFFELYPTPDSEIYDPPPVRLTKKGKVSKRQPRAEPREMKKFETVELWMRDRERKIRSWFYNHTSKGRGGRARLKLNIGVGSVNKPRVLSEANLYSKKYYLTRIKKKVDEEVKDVDDADMRIAITKRCLHESWKSETLAIKTEIRELRKKLLKERKQEEEVIERIFSGEQNPEDMEPEEYLLAQESVDEIIDEILDLIATRTGWAVSLNMGGPDMSKVNGDITVKTYHVGHSKGKDTFWTATPNYDEEHAKPFRDWCRTFFAESTRLRRAIDIDEKKVRDPKALTEAGRGPGHLAYVLAPDTAEEVAARESRLTTEKNHREAGTVAEGVIDGPPVDEEEDNDDDDEGGQQVDGEGGEEGEEEGEEEMNWVHDENGVPVPVFVIKDPTATRAPDHPSNGKDPDNQQAAPHPTARDLPVSASENQPYLPPQINQATDPVEPPLQLDVPNLQPQASNYGAYNSQSYTTEYQFGSPSYKTHSQFSPGSLQRPNSQTQWGGWGWNNDLGSNSSGLDWVGGGMGEVYAWGNVAGRGQVGGASGFDASTDLGHVPAHVMNGQAQAPGLAHGNQGVGCGRFEYERTMGGVGGGGNGGYIVQATPLGAAMGSRDVAVATAPAQGLMTGSGQQQVPMLQQSLRTEGAGGGHGEKGGEGQEQSGKGEIITAGAGNVVVMGVGMGAGSSKTSEGNGETVVGGKDAERGGKKVDGRGPKPKVGAGKSGEASVSGGKRKQGTNAPSPKSKRLRHAPAATEFPEWIELAYGHLRLDMNHKLWLKLVDEWYTFEKAWASKGMSQSGRMPTAKRPTELGAWLPAPRHYEVIPKLPNFHVFADQWSEWWQAMQPDCRKGGEGRLPKPLGKDMNISSLKKGGALGMVVVLIGLRWWGSYEGLGDRWEQAVEDVESVFRCFQE